MQRKQTRLRIGFGLVAMMAVLAMVAFMTMVSSNGGATSVSAADPLVTPSTNYKILAKVTAFIKDPEVTAELAITKVVNQKIDVDKEVLWQGGRWKVVKRNYVDPSATPQDPDGSILLEWKPCASDDTDNYPQDEKYVYQALPCDPNYKVLATAKVVSKVGIPPNQTAATIDIIKSKGQKITVGMKVIWKGQRWDVTSRTPPDDQVKAAQLVLDPNPCIKPPATADVTAYPDDDGKYVYLPKPCNDGNLSGIQDLTIRVGEDGGEEMFSCISRIDHDAKTDIIKSSSVCYINSAGQGDLANVLNGTTLPCGDKAPPGTDNPPFCPDTDPESYEGIDCTGVEPCTGPGSVAANAIKGPPPPPPYTALAPQKGVGFFDPLGTSPECTSAGGVPCTAIRSCFADIGAGTLGPNLGTMIVTPNPKTRAPNDTPITKVKLTKGITNDECDNLSWTITGVLYGGLQVVATDADAGTPVAWRTSATDFDGDGCTDKDELAKPGTQPKGCGDDPWNPNDSNKSDFSGAYNIGVRVVRSATTPGFAGIYFNCLADITQTGTGKADGELVARAFCYTDSFFHVVNLLDSPGITGDGQAGGSPPFGALPIDNDPACGTGNTTIGVECTAAGAEIDCSRALAGAGDLDEDDDGTANDGCPSEAFGDLDSKHTELTGFIDNATNTMKIRGCFEDEDASSSVGNVYVEMTVGKNTGQGTVDIWTNRTNADCTGTYAFGDFGADTGAGEPNGNFNDAKVQIVRQPGGQNRDTDQDGLPNAIELRDYVAGPNGHQDSNCGSRDPFNPYDWYDIGTQANPGEPDGIIDLLNDILGVIDHWAPTGAFPYDVIYDRPPTMTGAIGHWNRGAPDGVIDLLNDILGVIDQWHPNAC